MSNFDFANGQRSSGLQVDITADNAARLMTLEMERIQRHVPRIPLNAVDLPYLIEKNVITLAEARQLLGFTE